MSEAESLVCPDLPAAHGYFTRRGGTSAGPYATLNCSVSSGDAADCVSENRARAARAVGADPARLLGLTQVHGATAVRVADPWAPGDGPAADAMVTDRRGLALGIITADCAPVLFVDPEAGVIGAAHAGWRGAVQGILEAALDAMAMLGARTGRVIAAIGPCIAQASYEVGTDLHDAVLADNPARSAFFTTGERPARWQFDLSGYCAARLTAAGVGRVHKMAVDTCADEARFFSHRRRTRSGGGRIGHQISIISL